MDGQICSKPLGDSRDTRARLKSATKVNLIFGKHENNPILYIVRGNFSGISHLLGYNKKKNVN